MFLIVLFFVMGLALIVGPKLISSLLYGMCIFNPDGEHVVMIFSVIIVLFVITAWVTIGKQTSKLPLIIETIIGTIISVLFNIYKLSMALSYRWEIFIASHDHNVFMTKVIGAIFITLSIGIFVGHIMEWKKEREEAKEALAKKKSKKAENNAD